MGRARFYIVFAVLAALCAVSSARPATTLPDVHDDNVCNVCLTAVRVMSDLLCDSGTTDFLMQIVLQDICPAFKDQEEQCQQFAVALVPVAIEWLRASATPAEMCSAVGVCPHAALTNHELHRPHHRYVEGADCPVCKFVVRNSLATLDGSADMSQEDVLTVARQACSALPSEFGATCSEMIRVKGGAMSTAVLNGMDENNVCAASGICNAALMSLRPAPLPAHTVQALTRLKLQQGATGCTSLRAGTCDTCKLTVMEMKMIMDNPSIQQDISMYAKTMCGSVFPGETDMCNSLVDMYAPLVFQELDVVMQPDSLCQGLHMCTAPASDAGSGVPWVTLTKASDKSSFMSRLFRAMMAKLWGTTGRVVQA